MTIFKIYLKNDKLQRLFNIIQYRIFTRDSKNVIEYRYQFLYIPE